MADLREQLLKAGLVSEKQAKQAEHTKKVSGKKTSHRERERQAKDKRNHAERESAARSQADREQTGRRVDTWARNHG